MSGSPLSALLVCKHFIPLLPVENQSLKRGWCCYLYHLRNWTWWTLPNRVSSHQHQSTVVKEQWSSVLRHSSPDFRRFRVNGSHQIIALDPTTIGLAVGEGSEWWLGKWIWALKPTPYFVALANQTISTFWQNIFTPDSLHVVRLTTLKFRNCLKSFTPDWIFAWSVERQTQKWCNAAWE